MALPNAVACFCMAVLLPQSEVAAAAEPAGLRCPGSLKLLRTLLRECASRIPNSPRSQNAPKDPARRRCSRVWCVEDKGRTPGRAWRHRSMPLSETLKCSGGFEDFRVFGGRSSTAFRVGTASCFGTHWPGIIYHMDIC